MQTDYVGRDPETGQAIYSYVAGPGEHLMWTGPVKGPAVELEDGTRYEVAPDVIAVQCEGHHPHPDGHTLGEPAGECHFDEVNHLIGMRYAQEGHPTMPDFVYDPEPYLDARRAKTQAAVKHTTRKGH